jgi:phosphotriesterase-related protein
VGRDPTFTRRAGAKAGIRTIVATGIPREAWQPASLLDAPTETLAAMMTAEIVDGIEDTGIRAGLIHVAVSRWLTNSERRSLSAAGMVQGATGVAVCVDLEIGSKGSEYDTALDILADGGADLSRVAVSNLVPRPDNLELCLALAGRGCFLGFTLFGQDHRRVMGDIMDTHPEVQASSIKGFIDRGLRDRIMLSQNVDHIELMTVNGGPGYAHLLTTVLPLIRSYNVSDEEVIELMVTNPGRWLAFPA